MSEQQRHPAIDLGGLWINEDKNGNKYMSGYLGEATILVFKNSYKLEDKHPDYKIKITMGKRQKEAQEKKNDDQPQQHQGGRQEEAPF